MKYKVALFLLLGFPVIFALDWVIEAYETEKTIMQVFDEHWNNTSFMVFIAQMSVAGFLAGLVKSNFVPDLDRVSPSIDRLVFLLVYAVFFGLVVFLVWIIYPDIHRRS